MTEERALMMWASESPGVLYLIVVFIAGAFVEDRELPWKLAAFSLGTAYLCTLAKSYEARGDRVRFRLGLARPMFWLSLVSGAGAGLALI